MVTEKLRAPVVAAVVMVIFAVRLAALVTVIELTVIPAPTFTVVATLRKFAPVKTTASVCPTLPVAGLRLVNVGAGLLTVKATLFEVPAPPLLVTEKLR